MESAEYDVSTLQITGGRPLDGTVHVQGAKNSVLPILAAAILARGETVIHGCPLLSDVDAAVKILRHFGCTVNRFGHTLYIDSRVVTCCDIPESLMKEMRSSVIFLGAILARTGEAVLSRPGGCELGPRPIDLHLSALRAMGAEVTDDGDSIVCRADTLHGCVIRLPTPSVGATENSMLAASCANGTVTIVNAAREPEIWDLQEYLKKLGARICGAGTEEITIEGTRLCGFAEHTVIPDRIAAATYLSAAAATGGRVEVTGINPWYIATVTDTLSQLGCAVSSGSDRVCADARRALHAAELIETRPYPGFPTDAQPPVMAASLRAAGTTVFSENIFTNRYRHVPGLVRLGADIRVSGRIAVVTGVPALYAADFAATDLRGGAALGVAALGAQGVSVLTDIQHIDRGYEDFDGCLRALGAQIRRVD